MAAELIPSPSAERRASAGSISRPGTSRCRAAISALASDSTVTAASGVQTINTPIAGSFALLKDGPGTVVLGAVNTYTGLTTIENGVLQLGNATALENTNVDVDVNNGLNINSLNARSEVSAAAAMSTSPIKPSPSAMIIRTAEYAGALSGTGEVIKIGTGIWTLDNPNSYSGWTILRGGEISVSSRFQPRRIQRRTQF